jgi:hypothetical protein
LFSGGQLRKAISAAVAVVMLAGVAACGKPAGKSSVEPADEAASRVAPFAEVPSPSGAGAAQPHVTVDGTGAFLLSWTEPDGEGHALKMCRLDGSGWEESRTIAARSDFFVNWADFPSIASSGSALYAHWLQRSATGTYDYDVMVSVSRDGGATWGAPFVVHDDGVKAEHGFASMLPLPDNRVGIAWLDGRAMGGGHEGGHGDMGLRYAVISPDGSISEEVLLDSRTCECCTTTITATPDGPLVAWRDRSDDEVRDIAVSRLEGGSWSAPATLHEDGWQIQGCPVNGPQSDSAGDRVVIAWFTAASGAGAVKLAFSSDGGRSFDEPVTLAAGERVAGYVDTLLVDADTALTVWMEDRGDRLELMMRETGASGRSSAPRAVASTTRGRTGFPRMAVSGREILLAWNEKGGSPSVRVARAMISE